MSAVLCNELTAEYRRFQSQTDSVAKEYGDFAPRWQEGERLTAYRVRLAQSYQRYSQTYKTADLSKVTDPATFNAVERAIYADALTEARQPTAMSLAPGELVERVETDVSGRRISRFYGDPEACWAPFKGYGRRLLGFGA